MQHAAKMRGEFARELYWRKLSVIPVAFGIVGVYDLVSGQLPDDWAKFTPRLGDVVSQGWLWWIVVALVALLVLTFEGAFRMTHSQTVHVPHNRDALVKAVHHFEREAQDYAGALEQAPELRESYTNQESIRALNELLMTKRQAYDMAEDELELQEKIAGSDFMRDLWLYRAKAHLDIMLMQAHTPNDPEWKLMDRAQFRERTKDILRDIDSGGLYWPQSSASARRRADSQNQEGHE